MQNIDEIFKNVKNAKTKLAKIKHENIVSFLQSTAESIIHNATNIIKANSKDMKIAESMGLSSAMLERLELNDKKLKSIQESIHKIALLDNPIDKEIYRFQNHAKLDIQKVSTPIGVIGIIYESRPNVTSDTAALCIKSGNACILKGGKEAQNSNEAITSCFFTNMDKYKIPKNSITMLQAMQNRDDLKRMLRAKNYIDLIIPRGGEGLINFVLENSLIPVIKQDKGVCHIFAHSSCNQNKAIDIIINAKTSRPSVCNSCECLLIDKSIADEFLPKVALKLMEKNTILKGNSECVKVLKAHNIQCDEIQACSYHIEYNDNILNLKIVDGLNEAIEHINEFSSGHSESILCEDKNIAQEFLDTIDSACVYVNASTRFSDGGEFGFGAEVGISTSKIHARGPMGIESLTSYKYKIIGNGQIRI